MDDEEIAVFVLIALAGLILLGWGARSTRQPPDDEIADDEDAEIDEGEHDDDPWR